MELSSGSKRANVPMGARVVDSIHAEPNSSSKQPFASGVSNGSLTVATNPTTNENSSSHSLHSLGGLTQATIFRPDNHSHVNASGGAAPGRAPADSNLPLNSSASGNCNPTSNNNKNEYKEINISSVNTSTLNRNNRVVVSIADSNSGENGSGNGVRYRECMKNHAANMGGYALDGCGEFMPSGEEGSLEALKCAACGCHRNFHRRELNGGSQLPNTSMGLLALPSPLNTSNTSTSNSDYGEADHTPHSNNGTVGSGPAAVSGTAATGLIGPAHYNAGHMGTLLPHLHHHHHHHHQYMNAWMAGNKALMQGGAGAAHHHAGGMHVHHAAAAGGGGAAQHIAGSGVGGGHYPAYLGMGMGPGGHLQGGGAGAGGGVTGGKRFRTKFTMEQREKMFEFSKKVGWRIQKQDEAAVQQFCAEAGIKRHVLKVWMHNNKNTFGKKLSRFPEAFNDSLPEPSS